VDALPTSPVRPRRAKGTAEAPRRRSARSGSAARPARSAWRAWVWAAAGAVFVAAFILDTGAVGGLFWASLAGHAGPWARIVAFSVLLLLAGVIACALYRPARPQPAKARKKAIRLPVRNDSPDERIAAIDGPAAKTPTGKTPTGKTPTGKTPAGKTPTGKMPAAKTPAAKTPAAKTPAARRRSPRNASTATDRP
jgi:hypothetical protein